MSKETILIIDDEKDLIKLLRYALEKEGYRVLSAETGEKGYELATTERPHAVVLDLMLPKIDGLEVCRLLKSNRETAQMPILMLTAKSTEIDQVVGLEMGASEYVTKPFSIKVFLVRLKNLLKKTSQPTPDEMGVLEYNGVTLDKQKHLVDVKGQHVDLTKTEFDLLSLLMERPGFAASREKIVSQVWGIGAIVSDAAINMQIKSLRDKLGECRDCIETVRGVGYRFC